VIVPDTDEEDDEAEDVLKIQFDEVSGTGHLDFLKFATELLEYRVLPPLEQGVVPKDREFGIRVIGPITAPRQEFAAWFDSLLRAERLGAVRQGDLLTLGSEGPTRPVDLVASTELDAYCGQWDLIQTEVALRQLFASDVVAFLETRKDSTEIIRVGPGPHLVVLKGRADTVVQHARLAEELDRMAVE